MNIVKTYGSEVQRISTVNPERARKLLLLGWHAQNFKFRRLPNKGLPPSQQYLAQMTMDAMIAPLAHPEDSVMVSLFTPCEVLGGLGLRPYSPEGFSCYISASAAENAYLQQAESSGIPETLCSYHRVFLGAAENGLMPKPRFIINTTLACDANLLTFKYMSKFYGVPQFVLDIPFEKTPESVAYVVRQLKEMTAFLEEQTGRKVDEDLIRENADRSRRTLQNYLSYLDLRRGRYVPGEIITPMYECFATHILLGSKSSERYTQMLLEDVKKAPAADTTRLLWFHTLPYWQQSLRHTFNLNPNVQIVACDMVYEAIDECQTQDPYEFMARRLIYSAFNGPVMDRIRKGIDMAKRMEANGAIYFCHWGCKHTLGGAQLAKKELEAQGIPTLILDGDGCDKSHGGEGQSMTRVEAFLEMLEAARHE